MSAFDFINNSTSQGSHGLDKDALAKKRDHYQVAAPNSDSQHNSSSSSTTSLSNKDINGNKIQKQNFRSSFSFINQNDRIPKPDLHAAKHQPLRFSTSFIMEDFIDDTDSSDSQNDDIKAVDEHIKKDNISKYFSLIEENYPATFVKRQDKDKKEKGRLFQSMSSRSFSSRQSKGRSPMAKSAFDFINHAGTPTLDSNTPSPSLNDEVKEIPIVSKSVIMPDKETQLLQATTRWQAIQRKKSEQIKRIQTHYENQANYYHLVQEIKGKIDILEDKKQRALNAENFEAAHKHAIGKEKMERDLIEMSCRNFEEQTRNEWQQLIHILQQEAQSAENMEKCCQEVKQERQRRLATFTADKNRLHDETIKQMEQNRAAIEREKSEIAFDLGMWNQSHADLDERMEEAVHEQVERKKILESTSATIQNDIEELKQRLKQLESEQETVRKELNNVEATINGKLSVFSEEVNDSDHEKKTIDARQKDVQHKIALLDEQDAKIKKDIEYQQTTQELNEQELNQLIAQMEQAAERAQASKAEQVILEDLLNFIVEKRNKMVVNHKAAIKKYHESIARKNREIQSIQDNLYQCEQESIDWEEETTRATSNLKSLEKLKTLAIENGQFEKAGALSQKIKTAQSILIKLEKSKYSQKDITLVNDQLKDAKNELSLLKQDLALTIKNQKTELGLVLESLKHQLSQRLQDESLKGYSAFSAIAEHEMQSIDAQLSDM